MSLDSYGTEAEQMKRPEPPRNDVESGMYALGIWGGGQTLYRYELNPLRDEEAHWSMLDHFEHSDPEVQRINFQNATAEPESKRDGKLQTVWIYAENLGRDQSVSGTESSSTDEKSENTKSQRKSKSDGREVGEIGKDTTYHRTLHAVSQLSDGEDDPVPVGEVHDTISDPKGTVYSAMTTLYNKKLVDRKKRPRKGKQDVNVYWVTKFGRGMLDELGEPS